MPKSLNCTDITFRNSNRRLDMKMNFISFSFETALDKVDKVDNDKGLWDNRKIFLDLFISFLGRV